MARPYKGERVMVTVRLPAAMAERIKSEVRGERHAFIVDAVAEKLENGNHGKQAEA